MNIGDTISLRKLKGETAPAKIIKIYQERDILLDLEITNPNLSTQIYERVREQDNLTLPHIPAWTQTKETVDTKL